MTDPIDIARQQQDALTGATWQPSDVDGVETTTALGMYVARPVGAEGPVLWFTHEEWQDPDTARTLQALAR